MCIRDSNETLAAGYVKALKELSERFGLKDDISAVTLSRYPDVITLHKASEMCIRDRPYTDTAA